MKIFVAASSTFDDRSLFEKTVLPYFKENPFKFTLDWPPELFCKENTQVAEWITDLAIPFKTVEYSDIPKDIEEVVLFWDGESKNVERLVNQYPNAKVFTFENKTINSYRAMLEKIHNEKWKEGCKELVNRIPNYFWVVAGSSSGKYHPQCDLGVGGLVRHTVMVCQVGLDLLDAEIFIPKNEVNEDLVLIACLFHDALKQGITCSGNTVHNHPLLAYDFVKENLDKYMEEEYLTVVCDAIKKHMGKWTTSKYMPDVVLEAPETLFEKLIHTADYVASRKYIGGLESWK